MISLHNEDSVSSDINNLIDTNCPDCPVTLRVLLLRLGNLKCSVIAWYGCVTRIL